MSLRPGMSLTQRMAAGRWLLAWMRGVTVQATRAFEPGLAPDRMNDAILLAIMLANLERAAERVLLIPDDPALAVFRMAAPDFRNVRDILSHTDAYLGGTGHLQRSGEVGDLELAFDVVGTERFLTVCGITLNVRHAAKAGEVLAMHCFHELEAAEVSPRYQ